MAQNPQLSASSGNCEGCEGVGALAGTGCSGISEDRPGGGRQPDACWDALERRAQAVLGRQQFAILQRGADQPLAMARASQMLSLPQLVQIERCWFGEGG